MVIHNINPIVKDSIAKGIPDITSHRILRSNDPTPPPYIISFPKGKKHKLANLKHCIPTGIPTIVIHHRQPTKSQLTPLINPPQINHIILPKHPINRHPFSNICKLKQLSTIQAKSRLTIHTHVSKSWIN